MFLPSKTTAAEAAAAAAEAAAAAAEYELQEDLKRPMTEEERKEQVKRCVLRADNLKDTPLKCDQNKLSFFLSD